MRSDTVLDGRGSDVLHAIDNVLGGHGSKVLGGYGSDVHQAPYLIAFKHAIWSRQAPCVIA
jgi:hypothetical protein